MARKVNARVNDMPTYVIGCGPQGRLHSVFGSHVRAILMTPINYERLIHVDLMRGIHAHLEINNIKALIGG